MGPRCSSGAHILYVNKQTKKPQNTLSFKTKQRSDLVRDFGDYYNKDMSFKKMKITFIENYFIS